MIGGRLLRKVGGAILGRVVNRITDRIAERRKGEPIVVGPIPNPGTASQPAVVKGWEMPPWLVALLDLLAAIWAKVHP